MLSSRPRHGSAPRHRADHRDNDPCSALQAFLDECDLSKRRELLDWSLNIYSWSELFCTHGVPSGNFPTRCYLPFVDHVLSFHHKDAVMQVNASACVIRNDPEPVANVNLGASWNG